MAHDANILAVGSADVHTVQTSLRRGIARAEALRRFSHPAIRLSLLLLFPAAALANCGSPFDARFTALQNLFTGTVARVASLVAVVIGGYQSAHSEPAGKKAVAAGATGFDRAGNLPVRYALAIRIRRARKSCLEHC